MKHDKEVLQLLEKESHRQATTINLIASENYVSSDVQTATASALTNKYAEGYPGKRYYAGCTIIDQIERIAIDRAKVLFSAEHANVQPHSGSQANTAAYHALLEPGDTVLAMDLSAGGHLTHGYAKNISGAIYQFVHYGVDQKYETINYTTVQKLAQATKPKLIIAGASSYARIINYEAFKKIADSVGALLLVDMAHVAGLIAAGLHPNPVPYADVVTSTTHKTLRGPRGGLILCKQIHGDLIDKAIMPGTQGGPLMHIIAAKAIALGEAQNPSFRDYQRTVLENCNHLANALSSHGLRIISGGTDTHQCTVDLQSTDISGKEAEKRLEQIGITVNRNCIPFDPRKPWITSGIRVGTAAITTRGAQKKHMVEIANIINQTVRLQEIDETDSARLSSRVQNIIHDIQENQPSFMPNSGSLLPEKNI